MSIFKNWAVKNLLIAAALVVAIFVGVNVGLKVFTRHDKSIEVPDLVGKSYAEAQTLAEQNALQLVVIDSVFVSRFRQGAVYAQNPKAGGMVKEGRKIYLTLNAIKTRQVPMPSLVGLSVRQARVDLAAKELVTGRLIYESDMATNNVLAQLVDSKPIEPGTKLDVGTVVDLKVGLNYEDPYTVVPSFVELPYHKALSAVHDAYLNIDGVVFDQTVRSYSDSLAAFVYRQVPQASDDKVIMGKGVRLYLTLDKGKVLLYQTDSTSTAR